MAASRKLQRTRKRIRKTFWPVAIRFAVPSLRASLTDKSQKSAKKLGLVGNFGNLLKMTVIPRLSTRHTLAVMGFFGIMNLYFSRIDLSIAIVAMVGKVSVTVENSNVTLCNDLRYVLSQSIVPKNGRKKLSTYPSWQSIASLKKVDEPTSRALSCVPSLIPIIDFELLECSVQRHRAVP